MDEELLEVEDPVVCLSDLNKCVNTASTALHTQMMSLFGDTKEIIDDINGEVI